MPLNNITWRGKNIKYRNLQTLARRLRVSQQGAQRIVNAQAKDKIFISTGGDIVKFNPENNPLFLQDFNVRRIPNKKLAKQTRSTIKNNVITEEITDEFVNLIIAVTFSFDISEEIGITRRKRFDISTTPENIEDAVTNEVENYLGTITTADYANLDIDFDTMTIQSKYSQQTLQLEDMKLRDATPLTLFNENIINNKETKDNCVRDYLQSKYKKISPKTINKLGDKDGVTPNNIKEFCIKYRINLIIYDIEGNVVAKHIPTKRNRSYANLYCIAHNNHLYGLKNKYLQTIKHGKVKIIDNATEKLVEFINKGIEPQKIKTKASLDSDSDQFIQSFIVKKVLYVENPDYNICYDILKKFGIEEKAHPYISLKNIGAIIEKLYSSNIKSVDSFFPQCDKFIKGGFNYNDLRDDYTNAKTIDKNKCYSYCLSKLPFLIQLDYRQSKITKHNKYLKLEDITDHYLYIIKPDKSSILLPDTNLYSGNHLKYCLDNGLKLFCLEEITTNKIFNYYQEMIHHLFTRNIAGEYVKTLLNVHIGKFERTSQPEKNFLTSRLCNKEESETISGYKTKIPDTNYYLVEQLKKNYYITNRKPISIQIKDYSRRILHDKMIKLNIKQKDVIKIKTDSISFIDKDNKVKILYNEDNYLGWKYEEFEPPKTNNKPNFKNKELSLIMQKEETDATRDYYNCYAGVGKTYHTINNIIPKLKDYLVLTPSHSALKEYKQANYNCDVIQKYEYSNVLPEEQNIIIDELFLCSRKAHDIIYKCILDNKNIYVLGDHKQLLPVNELNQFSNPYYYKALFNRHRLKTNYRNKFTIDYYKKLRNEVYDNYKEVIKHQEPDYKKADIIICYRNKTREKYNNLMLKHLGFKNKFQIGVKLICKSNDLRDKNIFNNFTFTIKEINKDDYILDDGTTISYKQLKNNFEPYYACTSYGIQGQSIKSYHYAKEDKLFLKNNNRLSYTIISRIKN
jgi:hypothetical protein